MEDLLTNNPSLKRLLIVLAGSALVAFDKKLGLNLSDFAIGSITTMVTGFLAQSAYKEVQMAKVSAAALVVTPSDAAKELGK